jgi:DNA-binding MarR family transcriptional regulator/GNAT superfamily N-acetyltransferase
MCLRQLYVCAKHTFLMVQRMAGSGGGEDDIEEIRRFNRFFTRRLGILERNYLKTPFSVTEARIIYELAHRKSTNIRTLRTELGLDPGYMSRLVTSLGRRGLIQKLDSEKDGREVLVSLTARGRKEFESLNSRSRESITTLLKPLTASDREQIVRAMKRIEGLWENRAAPSKTFVLRAPSPGEFGWVVSAHGKLYTQEYGWDERFEALVAEIVAKFVTHLNPDYERCWIAEYEGEPAGSVFCVRKSATAAQLRLLLVVPAARGAGVGSSLVSECIGFARAKGYRKVVLWTNDVLADARRIYERAGFRLVREEPHNSFGKNLVGQYWELPLVTRATLH